jgi:transposase
MSSSRGQRYSALAFLDETGFIDWGIIKGTFTRQLFHEIVVDRLLPVLNPYPLPRSVVILDNASIHMYPEFVAAVRSVGAIVVYLPTYSPDYNPIEVAFGLVKQFIQRHYNRYIQNSLLVLNEAFEAYAEYTATGNLFKHCGYDAFKLNPINLVG